MFCKNCGAKFAEESKFCASCGANVSEAAIAANAPEKNKKEGKNRERKLHPWRGLAVSFSFVVVAIVALAFNYAFAPTDKAFQGVLIPVAGVAFIFFLFYAFVLAISKTISNLFHFRRSPKKALATFFGIIIFLGIIYLVIRAVNDDYYDRAVVDLPLIQESLAEVEAQRLLGDMINAKKAPAGATMAKVYDAVYAVDKKINGLFVSYSLDGYQKAAETYVHQVLAAANGSAKWGGLADRPGDFRLNISQNQAREMLETSVKSIRALKEFGSNAIQRKDRDAMRYIAARLLVQRHWLDGLGHFVDAGIWAQGSIAPVFAQSGIYVPPVGPGCEVDIKTGGCKTSTTSPAVPTVPKVTAPPVTAITDEQKLLLEQETIPDCVRWGGTCTPDQLEKARQAQAKLDELERAIKQVQEQLKQKQAQEQAKQKQNVAPQVPATNGIVNPAQKETLKTPAPLATPKTPEVPQTEPAPVADEAPAYHYDESNKPKICLGAHAMGTYCAEDAIQSSQEIAASAIGFAAGGELSQEDWDKQFEAIEKALPGESAGVEPSTPSAEGGHEEGGLGVVSEDAPTEGVRLPRFAQVFSVECQGKGGYVGGANQVKGRLATTEGGYHCNYKQGVNNCWDFLTYSGGRYMGGDVGCKEVNLLPILAQPVPTTEPAAASKTGNPSVQKDAGATAPAANQKKQTAPAQKTAVPTAPSNPPKTTPPPAKPQTNPWDGSYSATQVAGGCSGSYNSDFLMPPASTLLARSTDWQVFVSNNKLITFPMSAGAAIDVSGNATAAIASGITGTFHFYRTGSDRFFSANIKIDVSEPDPGTGGYSSTPCTVTVTAKAQPSLY